MVTRTMRIRKQTEPEHFIECLSEGWRHWVLERLVVGQSPAELVQIAIDAGAEAEVALREVELIASIALPAQLRAERLELVLRLRRSTLPETLEIRSISDLDDFYARYYDVGMPVILADGASQIIESGLWTPSELATHFGHLMVRVDQSRDTRPEHYVNPQLRTERMRFADLLSSFGSQGSSNDVYMVSRNRVLEDELSELNARIVGVPDFLRTPIQPGQASLWIGPRGTITPLHHDTTNVFFAQLYSRKRIRMVSPLETDVLLGPMNNTFYSEFELDTPGSATVFDVELSPGMALFIPVGWWHAVVSLSGSISLSCTGFRAQNNHDDYRPGAIGNGRPLNVKASA